MHYIYWRIFLSENTPEIMFPKFSNFIKIFNFIKDDFLFSIIIIYCDSNQATFWIFVFFLILIWLLKSSFMWAARTAIMKFGSHLWSKIQHNDSWDRMNKKLMNNTSVISGELSPGWRTLALRLEVYYLQIGRPCIPVPSWFHLSQWELLVTETGRCQLYEAFCLLGCL